MEKNARYMTRYCYDFFSTYTPGGETVINLRVSHPAGLDVVAGRRIYGVGFRERRVGQVFRDNSRVRGLTRSIHAVKLVGHVRPVRSNFVNVRRHLSNDARRNVFQFRNYGRRKYTRRVVILGGNLTVGGVRSETNDGVYIRL